MNRNWFRSPAHDSDRSLTIVRIVLAFILATHPVYALLHPANIRGFGNFLGSHGVPSSAGVAWAVIFLQVACAVALAARRLVVPACVGFIFELGMGILLVHAPRWRTVGLDEGQTQQGAEFSVLMIALLLSILWAQWHTPAVGSPRLSAWELEAASSRQALVLVRIASASILIIHPLGALRDPAG